MLEVADEDIKTSIPTMFHIFKEGYIKDLNEPMDQKTIISEMKKQNELKADEVAQKKSK